MQTSVDIHKRKCIKNIILPNSLTGCIYCGVMVDIVIA